MSQALAIIIESDQRRRQILSMLVTAAAAANVSAFAEYADAQSAIATQHPALIICAWANGGAELIADRVAAPASAPDLILLTCEITAERIAICRRAGRAHLVPCAPLNLNALRNRILLQLEGPDTLALRLSRSGAALRSAVETLPALRRRLAL